MMRYRLIKYVMVGLWMATLLGSCSEDLYDGDGIDGEKGYITLRFSQPQAAVQETRATEHGDNTLNENNINFVDLYFFPNGKSNEDAVLVEDNHAVEFDTSGGDTTYFVKVRTGDELRVSGAVRTASGAAKPCSFRSSSGSACSRTEVIRSGRTVCSSQSVTPGRYVGCTAPSVCDGRFARKSPTSCAGAR